MMTDTLIIVGSLGVLILGMGGGLVLLINRVDKRIDGLESSVNQRIDGLDRRFDGLESRVDKRIDGLESSVNQRIDGLESRLDKRIDDLESSVNQRIDKLEADNRQMYGTLCRIEGILTRQLVSSSPPNADEAA